MSLVKWLPLFMVGAAMESITQLCLKKGAVAHRDTGGIAYYFKLLKNKWVLTGILFFFIEMAIWVVLLSYFPLSIAFPLTGIQKIFIILFTVFVLREKVRNAEWLGIGIITAGILIISQTT